MSRFIPVDAIKRLTRGSYEHLVSQLDSVLNERVGEIFGNKDSVRLLGTFPGYAIVASEDGRCARVKFEQVGTRVRFVSSEALDVPSYAEDEMGKFMVEEAKAVVDLFSSGSVVEANNRLRGLVALSGKLESRPKESDLVETWKAGLERTRPWLRLYEDRKDKIHRSVWSEMKQLEQDRIRPKFRKLYDGSTPTTELGAYKDLVVDSLQIVQERSESIAKILQDSYVVIRSSTSSVDAVGDGESVAVFTAFAEDLLEDISKINTIATESPKQVGRVDQLGQLHDKMADRLFAMEVAGRFISQMANRLSEPQ